MSGPLAEREKFSLRYFYVNCTHIEREFTHDWIQFLGIASTYRKALGKQIKLMDQLLKDILLVVKSKSITFETAGVASGAGGTSKAFIISAAPTPEVEQST